MLQAGQESGGTYTYSSQPRPLGQSTYRENYGNIMHDKRVVRGNTYAVSSLPASTQPDPLELHRQQDAHRRALARRRAREQFRAKSPPPVEGRKHIEVQTELYLEAITDRIEEADVKTQTDAFLDRPPTPLFVPAKTGQDVATQIEEGDLFDFNVEVKPILEVLVGKTVEQALLEVLEEEELSNLRAQQRIFEENRNAELVETQRLEEQERRRDEEKERRLRQQRDALVKERETAEKIAARAFAQSYLSDLVPAVFATLNHNGYFYDPVEREIETVFMPWLMDEAEKALDEKLVARMVLDELIRKLVGKNARDASPQVPEDTSTTEAEPTAQDATIEQKDSQKMSGIPEEPEEDHSPAKVSEEPTKVPKEEAEDVTPLQAIPEGGGTPEAGGGEGGEESEQDAGEGKNSDGADD